MTLKEMIEILVAKQYGKADPAKVEALMKNLKEARARYQESQKK